MALSGPSGSLMTIKHLDMEASSTQSGPSGKFVYVRDISRESYRSRSLGSWGRFKRSRELRVFPLAFAVAGR
jgi:hypothetical protein